MAEKGQKRKKSQLYADKKTQASPLKATEYSDHHHYYQQILDLIEEKKLRSLSKAELEKKN